MIHLKNSKIIYFNLKSGKKIIKHKERSELPFRIIKNVPYKSKKIKYDINIGLLPKVQSNKRYY